MKPLLTWDELSPGQQEAARQFEYTELLKSLCEDGAEFGDEAIQAGIKAAWEECERLRTPWFFGAAIHERVGDLLMQHIASFAQGLHYKNPDFGGMVSDAVLPQI